MLLRELRDNLQNLTKHKITNEYFANLFGTSPQNISKRIKNNSEATVREVAYKKGIKMRTFTLKPEYICDPEKQVDCPHVKK